MAQNDYYADGQWNFACDLCGKKNKSGDGEKTWDNFYVCKHHREERNPQDFLRGVKDDQTTPWSRPKTLEEFALTCTLQGRNGIAGYAVAGCAIASYVNLSF